MNPDQLFHQATQAHQQGNLPQAEQLYCQVVTQAPSHADAHHLLGLVCSQQGRHTEAGQHLQQAIRLSPANAIYQNNLGEVLRLQGQLIEAAGAYQQALTLAPDFAEAYCNLGNVSWQQGQADGAIRCYRQAIRFKPTYVKAYQNLSGALAERGQDEEAEAFGTFVQILVAPPSHPLGGEKDNHSPHWGARGATKHILFLDPLNVDYTPNTPYRQPLGGSQSALCYLAEAFAEQGHTVYLFNRNSQPRLARGVLSLTLPTNLNKIQPILAQLQLDAVIVCNYAPIIEWLIPQFGPKTRLILWTGHAHDQSDVKALANPDIANGWNAIAFVSEWQKTQYLQQFPLDPARCVVMRNAISPRFEHVFDEADAVLPQKQPPLLVYTSTPFRGLDRLLAAFPLIQAEIPDVGLKIFSSMKVYQWAEKDREFQHLYQQAQAMPGVEYVGSIPQPELAAELRQATVLAYPNTYAETSCIVVMEAMASGCRVVTSDLGALPETSAGFADLISFDLPADQYVEQFSQQVIAVLKQTIANDPETEADLKRQIDFANTHYTWRSRAQEWLEWLA